MLSIELFRLYLFTGMVVHKVVWEYLKRRSPAAQTSVKTRQSLSKTIVKIAKIGVLLFLLVQTLFLPAIFPISENPSTLRIIGLIIYTTGLIIAFFGRVQLGANWANIEDYQVLQGQSMVNSGIYRYIRHPAASATHEAAVAHVRALELRAEAERASTGGDVPIQQAEVALAEAELALAHTELRAPFDATVGRKNVEPGAVVQPGQPLLSLTRTDESWVIANFKETQVGRMQVGDPVDVSIDAFPDRVWHGRVASFSSDTIDATPVCAASGACRPRWFMFPKTSGAAEPPRTASGPFPGRAPPAE